MNKANGSNGIPAEIFQILKHNAVIKVLHSICQKIWETQSDHGTGNGQFSFQYQRRAMLKNVYTTTQLHSFQRIAR